jgi:6-methylsalicylate decarboxylase
MSDAARIDVHQHLLPPVYTAALERHGLGRWAPQPWSPAAALAMMDTHEIATGVLSLSTPGSHLGDDAEGRQLARAVNEENAELVKDHPGRFGMFATVPLPDIDGALETIGYAYDELGTDGVVLLANSGGTYLGDEAFEPVMAELNRRNAVVFVHPSELAGPPARGVHPTLADFLLDTTRAAISLVLHEVPRRYPQLRIILSHSGGFLPYAAHRIAELAPLVGADSTPGALLEDLSAFYFDTALSASATALPSLLAFARPGHILFGSDSPYAPDATVGYFTSGLDAFAGLDPEGHQAVNRGNAEVLLPRLAFG